MTAQQEDERAFTRRRSDQPSLTKNLGLVTVAIAIVGSIFTAGYNWRSVAIVEANQDQFVRKDVQAEQMQRVNDRLLEVIKQLEDFRAEARRKP